MSSDCLLKTNYIYNIQRHSLRLMQNHSPDTFFINPRPNTPANSIPELFLVLASPRNGSRFRPAIQQQRETLIGALSQNTLEKLSPIAYSVRNSRVQRNGSANWKVHRRRQAGARTRPHCFAGYYVTVFAEFSIIVSNTSRPLSVDEKLRNIRNFASTRDLLFGSLKHMYIYIYIYELPLVYRVKKVLRAEIRCCIRSFFCEGCNVTLFEMDNELALTLCMCWTESPLGKKNSGIQIPQCEAGSRISLRPFEMK